MIPAAPTTRELQRDFDASVQTASKYFGVSLACLIAGGVGAVMLKADKLSYKDFCRLATLASLVGLVSLYKWRQAVKHADICFWSLQEHKKQDKQALFDKVFPVASKFLLANAEAGLFRTTDNSSSDATVDALEQGQISAERAPVGVAIDLKRLFQKAGIVGSDLRIDQQEQVCTFAQALVNKQLQDPQTRWPLTWASYVKAWPGELPIGLETTKLANMPWLYQGGLLDLAVKGTIQDRRRQYEAWTTVGS